MTDTNKLYAREFGHYIFMNIIAQIGISFYIIVDTFFISKGLGSMGLTALNLALPVFNLIFGVAMMLGMGGGTKYAVLKAGGNQAGANEVFTNTIYMVGFFSILFVVPGLLFSREIARLLGAGDTVFDLTHTYVRTLICFAPAFLLNTTLGCFVRNDGNPNLSMASSLVGSFSNIILDYVFIFPMGMGIFGAILATGLAPVISIGIMVPYLLKGRQKFRFKLARPEGTNILSVFRLGLPSFVVEMSSGIVIIIYNYIILGLKGDVGVAAYGVVANISVVAIAIFTGIAQGMQPICSKAFGRGHHSSAARIKDYASLLAAMVALLLYGVIFVFAKEIATMFNGQGDPFLQTIAVEGLKLYFIGILFAGLNIVMSNYFVSVEWAWPAHIITLARGIVFLAPLAIGLSALWGIRGTWLAFPVCEGAVLVLSAGLLILHKRRVKNA